MLTTVTRDFLESDEFRSHFDKVCDPESGYAESDRLVIRKNVGALRTVLEFPGTSVQLSKEELHGLGITVRTEARSKF